MVRSPVTVYNKIQKAMDERGMALKLWHWFCKIGEAKAGYKAKGDQTALPAKSVSERVRQSEVDTVCSRVCGHENCQCGGTMRGLHCVWSYYRLE
jgi:hypothetical protein